MKKLTMIFMLLVTAASAQTNFQWEITDSTAKTKDQIYSDTKAFIADKWKSSKDVIQSDDKDGGIIVVKGASIQSPNFAMNTHTYIYHYTVKFMMKDNKYKFIITDVTCVSSTCAGNVWPLVPASDNTTDKIGKMPTAKRVEMMNALRKELQDLADSYSKQMKAASVSQW